MPAVNTALSDSAYQGWYAQLELGFQKKPAKTVLSKRSRQGPLAVQRAFYPEDDVCHVYLLHPPGGVVGGDQLDISVNLEPDSHALLTTPGATKFYLSAGETAIQQQVFNVSDNAVLEWLPQENILFPGAIVSSSLRLNLEGSARAALWEIQCLGRPVINEVFDTGSLDTHWQIFRDNKPLLIERLRVDKDKLNRLSQMAGYPVTGTFIISNADKQLLEALRQGDYSSDAGTLALTLIQDLLIIRYLGNSTEQARGWFAGIWSKVRMTCLGKKAVVPRIWNT